MVRIPLDLRLKNGRCSRTKSHQQDKCSRSLRRVAVGRDLTLNIDFEILVQRAFPCVEFQTVVAMSKRVCIDVKVYALSLTNELINGKGVASEPGQPTAIREIGL
jgi:hypothetical protein